MTQREKECDYMENRLKVKDVARLMNVSEQFVRACLQDKVFPFGYATKINGSSRWTYYISPTKFQEYTGIKVT